VAKDINKGNPWHDPITGKFSDAPPGVYLASGALEVLKGLDGSDKRFIDDQLKKYNGEALSVKKMSNGQLGVGIVGDKYSVGFSMVPGSNAPDKGAKIINMKPLDGSKSNVIDVSNENNLKNTDTTADVTSAQNKIDLPSVKDTSSSSQNNAKGLDSYNLTNDEKAMVNQISDITSNDSLIVADTLEEFKKSFLELAKSNQNFSSSIEYLYGPFFKMFGIDAKIGDRYLRSLINKK